MSSPVLNSDSNICLFVAKGMKDFEQKIQTTVEKFRTTKNGYFRSYLEKEASTTLEMWEVLLRPSSLFQDYVQSLKSGALSNEAQMLQLQYIQSYFPTIIQQLREIRGALMRSIRDARAHRKTPTTEHWTSRDWVEVIGFWTDFDVLNLNQVELWKSCFRDFFKNTELADYLTKSLEEEKKKCNEEKQQQQQETSRANYPYPTEAELETYARDVREEEQYQKQTHPVINETGHHKQCACHTCVRFVIRSRQ